MKNHLRKERQIKSTMSYHISHCLPFKNGNFDKTVVKLPYTLLVGVYVGISCQEEQFAGINILTNENSYKQ